MGTRSKNSISALAKNNRGAADLLVRAGSPVASPPMVRDPLEKAITGVRLYRSDAIRLRALRADKKFNASKFLRDAVRAALASSTKETL